MRSFLRRKITDREAKLLPRLSLFFFQRPKITFLVWVLLVGFGALSYTTLLQRQGFPPVQSPLSIVNGTYLVNDPQKVDKDLAVPVSEVANKQDNVKAITTTSDANTMSAFVEFKQGTDATAATAQLEQAVKAQNKIPRDARVTFKTLEVSKYSTTTGESYDLIIAFYGQGGTKSLADKANLFAQRLNQKQLSLVQGAAVVNPFTEGTNPQTGQMQTIQTSFDRYGERIGGTTVFHNDVVVGIKAQPNADAVKLLDEVTKAVNELNNASEFKSGGYKAAVTAAFGTQIKENINELQKTLLEGLLAVLIVGSILVALRASLLIIISMLSVIAITVGVLYVIGYTLNVITLFAIILGLSLIVDDTIIMTEALDVERRRQKNADDVVKAATRKVSLAMVAATSTAALAFAPIVFISGILGGFIRPIPITIIISLAVSLFVALTIIPFFARFLILRKKDIGANVHVPLPVRWQESFAHLLTAPLRWTHHSSRRLWTLGVVAIIISLGFVFGGAYIFKYLTFNIFPNNKDSNQLSVTMQFPAGTDLAKAQQVSDKVDNVVAQTLDGYLVHTNYYGTASQHYVQMVIDITPYTGRAITAPQLVDRLKDKFKNFKDATLTIGQLDVGGPPGGFDVHIETTDRADALALGQDMTNFLNGKELKRPNGKVAHITVARVASSDSIQRKNGKEFVDVNAQFDSNDTSTLVTLAQDVVKKEYTNQRVAKYHLKTDNIVYDFGFESENQQSFKAMVVAFPILLLVMYLLLALEFRSLLQPILIFMAIPFSFFGITAGLWLTHNPFSFFTMLGFFALIGLSIKNTILLIDYANQARRAGLGRVEAIASALEERFRPLLATSVTAIFSLLPLALTSPFWEALVFTLIFGLISSTTLVILVFPYYYLGGEYLRMRIGRMMFFSWVVVNVVVLAAVAALTSAKNIPLAFLGLNLLITILKIIKHKTRH